VFGTKSLQIEGCAPCVRQSARLAIPTLGGMEALDERVKTKLPSGRALWRLNQLGLLDIRPQPRRPISRKFAAEILTRSAQEGLWEPGQSRP
jgi:hypothetical protein